MPIWVALLRAVNVGGKNRIRMGDLRGSLVDLGFAEVESYIQSGNLIFGSDVNEQEISNLIRNLIADRYGMDISVLVRSGTEMVEVASANPFAGEETDPRLLHTVFADREVTLLGIGLDLDGFAPDRVVADGRHMFLHYPHGSGRSKLTVPLLEKFSGFVGTGRNQRTVGRLAETLQRRL